VSILVKHLADVVYKSPELLTNQPDWVLKYGKGRLQQVGDIQVLPNQKVTVTNINPVAYQSYEEVEDGIKDALSLVGMESIGTKIKHRSSGKILGENKIAAIVYFESSYHAICALQPLKSLGRVHLGRTVATSRVRSTSSTLYIYIY
jgi:hypothetical protein